MYLLKIQRSENYVRLTFWILDFYTKTGIKGESLSHATFLQLTAEGDQSHLQGHPST
jgi:hypothetical protein